MGSARYTMSSTGYDDVNHTAQQSAAGKQSVAIDAELRQRILNGLSRDTGSSSQCYGPYQVNRAAAMNSKRKAFTSEGGSRAKRSNMNAAVNGNMYRLRQALES